MHIHTQRITASAAQDPYQHSHAPCLWSLNELWSLSVMEVGYVPEVTPLWLRSAHMPVVTPDAADFHSTLTSTEGQIVEVQETTRSTSEYYKAILCLVVLRLGHIKHCWANCHRPNLAIPQDQESYVRANKTCLMQMWFCMHCMDQCFIPVIQHALRIQSASCTSVQIGNLTIWCTYLILHLRYFKIFKKILVTKQLTYSTIQQNKQINKYII